MVNYYPYTLVSSAGGWNGAGATVQGAWASGNEESEVVDALALMYTGAPPTGAAAPSIGSPGIMLSVGGTTYYGGMPALVQAGALASASVSITTKSVASLSIQWLLLPLPSSPTDHNTYSPVLNATGGTGIWSQSASGGVASCTFQAPATPGAYCLAVWAADPAASLKFATHNVCFNSTLKTPLTVAADGDTFVWDAALYSSPGCNAGFASCTSGNLTSWHPANSYQATANENYGSSAVLSAQAYRPLGSNRYPFLHFSFTAASPWVPSPSAVPVQALLYVFSLGGDPSFTLTAYGVPPSWNESTLTCVPNNPTLAARSRTTGLTGCRPCRYAHGVGSTAYAASIPQAVGLPVGSATVQGGIPYWVAIDVTAYIASVSSAGLANALSFALLASSATAPASPVATTTLIASKECTLVSGATCTAVPGAGGAYAAFLAISPASASVQLQLSNSAASALAASSKPSGRRLLDLVPASPPSNAASVAALQASVASLVGVSLSSGGATSLNVISHSVSAAVVIDGAHSVDSWGGAVQQAFVLGVSLDLNIDASLIALALVHDTEDFSGLDVPFSLNGFTSLTGDGGLAAATAAAAGLQVTLASTFALVGAAVFNSTGRKIADIHISATPTVFAQARFLQPSL